MAFWGVEVKPGEPYVHESSRRGRLRITQATLGNLESVGGTTIECSVGRMTPVRLCALNSTWGMCRLDLEYDEQQNVVFSVIGDSSVHLTGYYKISDEASLGSGHRPVHKEDVGAPINELKIDELKKGDCNAEIASDGKEVEVKYIGMLKDGEVIDSCEGHPAICKFMLGAHRVIAGWEQGIQGMRVGGKRKLTIPPALAYGDIPQMEKPQKKKKPDKPQKVLIPANSWLVYEIELLSVSDPGEENAKKKLEKSHSHNLH